MKQVILLSSEHQQAAPALVEALAGAGIGVIAAASSAGGGVGAPPPLAVLYEITNLATLPELHGAAERAALNWPATPLIACHRPADDGGGRRPSAPRLSPATLKRLGFRAVADEPAQLPVLLRQLEERGTTTEMSLLKHCGQSGFTSPARDPPDSGASAALLLPPKIGARRLRAAYEIVARLHLAHNQKSAGHTALTGLTSLVQADWWTIFLTSQGGNTQESMLEPLTVHGDSARANRTPPDDRQGPPPGGNARVMSIVESRAAKLALATAETVRVMENGRRIIAVPLVNGEQVLGILEGSREAGETAAAARSFSRDEAQLLEVLAVPLAAALANAVRIAAAERLSQTDDLTKLRNARFLRQYLVSEIKRARRYGSSVAAVFLELDDFKQINDEHGHLVGSHVLMELAAVILSCLRDTDVVTRYGGDEFVVVLPEATTEQAMQVAERVRARVADQVFNGVRRMQLRGTASFGVAAFPQHASSPQQLIASADAAMYEAKAARKNCVRFATRDDLAV